MEKRETLSNRLGFILLSAGCAIGLGNIWRFPYITGQYGGGLFVLIYIVFLVILGLPIMTAEFAVGRGSQRSVARAFHELQGTRQKWSLYGYIAMAGNYFLMMFYTTVGGWIMNYTFKALRGQFATKSPDELGALFGSVLENPWELIFWMVLVSALGFFICSRGLKKGVEKVSKGMMITLLILMFVLVVRSMTLPGAAQGLSFYLKPNFQAAQIHGWGSILDAAVGQAFFTLSIGMG